MLLSLIKNKIFIYLSTRYVTYGLQFLVSLIIAVKLGPYYLGIYGVVLLIQSYLTQLNFGIPHSLNVLLVHNKSDSRQQNKLIYNSIILYSYLNIGLIIITICLYIFDCTKWGDYDLYKLLPYIMAGAIIAYYNSLATTIIRFKGRINLLSIIGSIPVLFNLLILCFFEGWNLVLGLTVTNLLSCILVITLASYNSVFPKFSIHYYNKKLQTQIIKKGLFLFIYNSCFYFIIIGIRTIISRNYSIEDFGYFTFSYTIANAVLLLLDSLNTIIFPKIIDLFSKDERNSSTLSFLRVGYITTAHLLIYLAIMAYPLFLFFFPEYKDALTSMNLVSLAILMNTNSYGFNTLLIAKNKEKTCSRASLIALVIALGLGYFISNILKTNFAYVMLSVLVAYLVFSFIAFYEGSIILQKKASFKYCLLKFFPFRLLIPYITALIIVLSGNLNKLVFLPLIIFLVLNFKDLFILKSIVKKLISSPNVIDV